MKSNSNLPSLPLPLLADTLERYLLCLKAIVPEGQFDRSKAIVNEFGKHGGVGERLQEKLKILAENEENWAYSWWLNDMYLENRLALPVNSNPGMVLPRQNFSSRVCWLRYAAKMTVGILDFKLILDARALPTEMARGQLAGQALCMEQYYRLLRSYRLPGKECDRLLLFRNSLLVPTDGSDVNSVLIVVSYRNQFFAVNVMRGSYRLTELDFLIQFQRIVHLVDSNHEKYPMVGILTSENRDVWANARQLLLEDPVNRVSLDNLERCVFIMCLDRPISNENNETNDAHQMLHGCGSQHNSGNRWFDKTIQLIISEDGNVGVCYEHSVSEGIAVKSLIEHLITYISQDKEEHKIDESTNLNLSYPTQLKWSINKTINKIIDKAQKNSIITAERLDLKVIRFLDYGKKYIKHQNMSPDAFVQVAIQLTYYKIYGHLVSTYESASLRRFRQGRVENIRAATVHVLELAKNLFSSDNSLDALKMNLLKRAIKVQTQNTKSCITGNGFDNHLLALRKLAEELGIEKPSIFEDPSYAASNYFTLSTSQIPTSSDSYMCYGAVVPNGYGISYNPKNDSITFCIASFRDCSSTNSNKFACNLLDVLRTLKALTIQWNRLRRSSSVELLNNVRKVSLHWPEMETGVPAEKSDLRHGQKAGASHKKKIEKRKTFTTLPIKSEKTYQRYQKPVRQYSEILTSKTWTGEIDQVTPPLPVHLVEYFNEGLIKKR